MNEASISETTLSNKDSYVSIAFQGKYKEHLMKIIDEVKSLSNQGKIHAPFCYYTPEKPYPKRFIGSISNLGSMNNNLINDYNIGLSSTKEESDLNLTPAEAVAIKAVSDEVCALSQNIHFGDQEKIIQLIKNNFFGSIDKKIDLVNFSLPSFTNGISEFCDGFNGVVMFRNDLRSANFLEKNPDDPFIDFLMDFYSECLASDKMVIGKNTVFKIIDMGDKQIERKEKEHLSFGEKKEDSDIGINSSKIGLRFGALIYWQAFNFAAENKLPTSFEKVIPLNNSSYLQSDKKD